MAVNDWRQMMVRLEDVGMVRLDPKGREVAILAGISFWPEAGRSLAPWSLPASPRNFWSGTPEPSLSVSSSE